MELRTLAVGMMALVGCGGGAGSGVADVSVDLARPLATVDPRFLSFTVDSARFVGGPFWARCAPDAPSCPRGTVGNDIKPPFDFTSAQLKALTRELAPAYLRLGGSHADEIFVDLSPAPVTTPPPPFKLVLDRTQWDAANTFAREVGLDIMFTLNAGPGPRTADGSLDVENARVLVRDAVARQYPIAVWELGNEINAFPYVHGISYHRTPEQFAEDVARTRAMLDEESPKARLSAPSSAYWPVVGELRPMLDAFLRLAGPKVDVVAWHYYPQQSRRCLITSRPAGPRVMLDEGNLDEVARWAWNAEQARGRHAPAAELWLGETGNAQCGGEPGVSDAFAGGFWWLDQLGQLAARGHAVVVRQTLAASDYALLDEDLEQQRFVPRPDYWTSVLWRRLMGTTVLAVERTGDPSVRVYAHCARAPATGVVLAWLNTGPRAVTVTVPWSALELYTLGAQRLGSTTITLNGQALELAGPLTLPPMPAASATGPTVELPGEAYGFIHAPQAAGPACPAP